MVHLKAAQNELRDRPVVGQGGGGSCEGPVSSRTRDLRVGTVCTKEQGVWGTIT